MPLTEDVPTRGSPEHYYSAQKAACEAALADITQDSSLEVFVLRPCIVAGPHAPALADAVPWKRLPGPVRAVAGAVPVRKPVVPDPGFPLQLVHHDDVATAIALAATAPVPPGAYNIAGNGEVTIADVAKALGGRPVRVVRGDFPVAVRPFHSRMAACGADIGGDGYQKSAPATWLASDALVGGDACGAGSGGVTLVRPRR